MINILLRIIPYSIFIRLYYYFFKKKKEVFFSSLDTDKYRSLHNIDNLLRYKTSDKLFIIGSGYSLNNLSETDWKEINSHDVFGFNFSFLNNDHIPTFYACEAMAPMSTNEFGRSSTADIFFQMYKSKCEKYRNVVKILTDLDENRKEHFENYGRDMFDDNFFILKTVNGVAQNEEQFARLIRYYDSIGIFDKKEKLDEVFKFRATLSMAISFGINLGYKEIILCGIDLIDPRYFYQNTDKYPEVPSDFQSSPLKKSHTTYFDTPSMVSIVSTVKGLYALILKNRSKLFVINPNSALSSFLPVYKN